MIRSPFILKTILAVLMFLQSFGMHAQDVKQRFMNTLAELKVAYNKPEGFSEYDTTYAGVNKGKSFNLLIYTLINQTNDIAIGFSRFDIQAFQQDYRRARLAGLYLPRMDDNLNERYLTDLRDLADDANATVMYDKDYASATFNADATGECSFNWKSGYKDKYHHVKVVVIHKEDLADIKVFYFYTEQAKERVESLVKNTASIIKFQ